MADQTPTAGGGDEIVLFDVEDGVATITLNRPESLNSMTNELMGEILAGLRRVADDETIRVLVLTGNGRGFCSGADLSSDNMGDDDGVDPGEATAQSMDDFFNPVVRELSNLPVPSIAKINGVAAGGGFGLSMCTDISIAARSAFFVATFGPRLGIVPDVGTTWHLANRAGRARALGISMLGERLTADEAKDMGLIWDVVDDEELDAAVADIARRLSNSSPDAMRRIRHSIDVAANNTVGEQVDVERDHQRALIPRNMDEGAAAFREKREPRFDGARTAFADE